MRIAHVTDLHLRHHLPGTAHVSARLSRRVPGLFAQAVADIAAWSPDLLVVSGDLLDYPSYGLGDRDLERAGEMDLRLLRELLDRAGRPYAVVPGNHDHPSLVGKVFGDLSDDRVIAAHRVICFCDEEVECHVPQRLGRQRERFLAAVADAASPPQIHVQHYLVWPEKNEHYPHSYREAEHLRQAIVGSGRVRLVLSGHYHDGLEPFRENDTWFAVPPAFAEPPHPYWLYELEGDELRLTARELPHPAGPGQRAVFLDRDGTINPQPSYRTGPDAFELLPGVRRALAELKRRGFALVVVSNQSAVGHGFVTGETVQAVNDKMARLLAEPNAAGEPRVELDGVYCCYHSPTAALPEYRGDHPDIKPGSGMALRAARDLHLDLSGSFVVGDSECDLELARRIGARGVLVRTGAGRRTEARLRPGLADAVVDDLQAAGKWIATTASASSLTRTSGCFADATEVDAFIRAERDSWER